MATLVGTSFYNPGTSNPSSADISLPVGSAEGDIAVLVCSINAQASTTAFAVTGWTEVGEDSPNTAVTSNLFYKTLTAADITAGQVNVAAGTGGRLTIGMAVWTGSQGVEIVSSPSQNTASSDGNVPVPALDPTAVCHLAMFAGISIANAGTGVTPPSGFTERVDQTTTNGTGRKINAYIATYDTVSDAAYAGGTAVGNANVYSSAWTVAIIDAAPVSSGDPYFAEWDGAAFIPLTVAEWTGSAFTNLTPYIHPEPAQGSPVARPMIFGAATTNNQNDFNALNSAWGPIRMSREYDGGAGPKAVNQYSWYDFVSNNFNYVAFSWKPSSNSAYDQVAAGAYDAGITAMLNSLPTQLPGVKGTILLGNEVNAPTKNVNPAHYRAALEYLIDTFGDEPAPGFIWGVAFTNFVSWGQGRTEGENWLPNRPNSQFMMETHIYGKTSWTPVEDMLSTFLPAVQSRPAWNWGIGETSAQESGVDPNRKGTWFKSCANFCSANGGSYYLVFDTGVGGSDVVGSTPTTSAHVKDIAEQYQANDWA